MKYKILLTLLLLLKTLVSYCQMSISGKVLDGNGQPIELVTVVLTLDSSIVETTISDTLGIYSLNRIQPNEYVIEFSHINFSKIIRKIKVLKDTIINVQMKESDNKLKGVTVNAKIPMFERKPGMFIFNVAESVISNGNNVINILDKTPLVSVQNENISLLGRANVKIMIDNRLIQLSGSDLINYLRSIPSDNILRVEVITNPSARYDASGNSGILNIVTKKTKKLGWNGSIQSTLEQTFYSTGKLGAYISNSSNRMNFFTSLNYSNGRTRPVEKMNVIYHTGEWKQGVYRKKFDEHIGIQAGFEYNINKNNTLGINYSGLLSAPLEQASGKTEIFNTEKTLDSFFVTKNRINDNINMHDFNIKFRSLLDTNGKAITFSSNYLRYFDEKKQSLYSKNFLPNNASTGSLIKDESLAPQNIGIYTADVDFQSHIKKVKLNLGAKLTLINIDNDFRYFKTLNNQLTKDPKRSNHFIYSESVHAAYISSAFKIADIDFQLGIRGENTITNGESATLNKLDKNNYFKIFPSLSAQYTFNDRNVVSFSYSKRINRPAYRELNPFRYYFNAYQYSEGNPSLSPSYSNSFEVNYIRDDNYFFGLFYQIVNNKFDQIPVQSDTAKVINFTRQNIGNVSALGNYIIIPLSITEWWRSNNTLVGSFQQEDTFFGDRRKTYEFFSFSFHTDNIFYLNSSKTFQGELNFKFSGPTRNNIYHISDHYTIDAGIKYSLLNEKLSISAHCTDIFYTDNPVVTSLGGQLVSPIEFANRNDNRRLTVSFAYNFGTIKKKKEVGSSNKGEKDRIN